MLRHTHWWFYGGGWELLMFRAFCAWKDFLERKLRDGLHGHQGRIQDFVLGGAYRDGNGGVPLQTCQGVWESAVSTIIPAPKP